MFVRAVSIVGLLAAALLAGCTTPDSLDPFAPSPVNPESAVAKRVEAESRSPGAFPKWADVPPAVTDATSETRFRDLVVATTTAADTARIGGGVAPATTASDSSASSFVAQARADVTPGDLAAPLPDQTAAAEAFAAQLRARATPPPPKP